MELIIAKGRQPTAEVTSREPWAVAIRRRYGNELQMQSAWSPAAQAHCASNLEKSATSVPFVRLIKSYGENAVQVLLAAHMADAIITMADADSPPINKSDIFTSAGLIVTDTRLMTLPMGMLLVFFHRAKSRRYKIYGKYATPQKLLETLQQEFPNLLVETERIRKGIEERERAARLEEQRHNSMSWEDYKASRGLVGENPLTAMMR